MSTTENLSFITKFWLLILEPDTLNEIVCFDSLLVGLRDWKQLHFFLEMEQQICINNL